jgi:hypothetical protein
MLALWRCDACALAGTGSLLSTRLALLAVALGACVTLQMGYLNKALDAFHTSRVTPTYYALFTCATLLASGR